MKDKKKIIGSIIILTLFVVFLFVGYLMTRHKDFKSNEKDIFVESPTVEKTKIESAKLITVCIQGGVKYPGVYKIETGSIINDLIKKAGGYTADAADNNKLNLAKKLKDEDYIYISKKDEIGAVKPSSTGQNGGAGSSGKVNINSASIEELNTIPGIGPVTAKKIVDYREKNGDFTAIEDLKKIGGIGDKTLNKFKDKVDIR